ncbi:hypothetical protein Tco_0720709, partial [Tanacetum coccineum]
MTESQKQDTSSRSGNDAHVKDANIRPIYNEEPIAEVQTTDDNVSATGQQHTEQPEFNNKKDQSLEFENFLNEGQQGIFDVKRPPSSMFKRRLIADQASVFMAMTSDHNRSELGIQDHSNEPSSSKLVPKVVPLAVKTATSRQELELLFHHHIAMLRTT